MRFGWKISPALVLAAFGAVAQPAPVPDEGLVHIPSSRDAAVYRSPDVNFTQYKRLIFDATTVTFKGGWRRDHYKLTEAQVERVRSRAATGFQEEIRKELVDRGRYPVAEAPGPDVLRIKPLIVGLDQTDPMAGTDPTLRTFARTAVKMTLIVELYDSSSGVLVGRITDLVPPREYPEPRRIDQVFIETEARRAFANAALLAHEALSVAMIERPKAD
jgi:hypothetical protein